MLNNYIHCPYVRELFYINPNICNFRNAEYFRIRDPKLSRTTNAPTTQICKYANSVKDLFVNDTNRNNFNTLLKNVNDNEFL